MNMVTHIVGGALGITALVLCVIRSALNHNLTGLLTSIFYGVTMIATYTMSSIYHGLRPCIGKKVLQVIDHCTIYSLIAGTYTPVVLTAIAPKYPFIGWGLFAAEWALAALAITLTAIDLKKFNVISMILYVGMGWGIALFLPQTLEVLTFPGFMLLLLGGVSYTVGAILYGIGSKRPWMHSVFHIFVVLGSLLHFLSISFYVL
jgi:hemolysin III